MPEKHYSKTYRSEKVANKKINSIVNNHNQHLKSAKKSKKGYVIKYSVFITKNTRKKK